ncbi:hypothetical protein WA026_020044 [Henosepilachna vigintioctopunctata]|uniref:Uncharacterized protein n=1 Tax=Henosepilachna vigintioctopunctata TaxID=420089 RepID=A0AAW1V0Y3_9CUCU
MDIMEATPQTTNDESINQLQYNQSNFETIATDDFKDENVTTFNHSQDNFNISTSSTEFHHELIIKENILDGSENDISIEYPVTTQSMDISECVPAEQSHSGYPNEISPEIVLNSENLEFSAIPLQENIGDIINPAESELNAALNETIPSTGVNANLLVSSQSVENINTSDSVVNEKVEIIKENSVQIIEKDESIISESNEHVKDEGLPLFIGEVDESVSLPPAEPLITEHGENTQPNTDMQANVEKEVIQNSVEEHNIQENIVEGNADQIITADRIEENEIEATHAEIISEGETHVQYTVLPPGENSVYQEDGTLVVEYPLNNITELNENVTDNSDNLIEVPSEKGEMAPDTEIKVVKPQPKPKGRKPGGQIPLHILGHNINKPVQDVLNGKPVLKPRLGVKIPYRNLASQIVSTNELRQQIVERARQKQEAQTQVSHSNMFAKKLTHRLAQSLSGKGKFGTLQKEDSNNKKKSAVPESVNVIQVEEIPDDSKLGEHTSNSVISNPIEIVETGQGDNIEYIQTLQETINSGSRISKSTLQESDSFKNTDKLDSQNSSSNIESNSDLIAILEGDGDEVSSIITVPKPVENQSFDNNSSDIKEIEKEISLTEQKTQAPQAKGKKFFKSRESRFSDNVKEKVHNAKDTLNSNQGSKDSEFKNSKLIGSVSTSGEIKIHSTLNIQDDKISAGLKNLPKSAEEKKNTEKNISEQKERKFTEAVIDVEPRLKPTMALKTYTRKRKSNDVSTSEPTKKQIIESPSSQPDPKIDIVSPVPPNVYVTKSSRVIKRKVIWDPDEAMPSVRNQSKILSKIESTTKGTSSPKVSGVTTKASTSRASLEKKSVQDKQMEISKSAKPIEKKAIKVIPEEKKEKSSATPDKQLMKKPDKTEVPKKMKSPTVVKNVVVLKNLTVVKGQSAPTEEDVKYQQGRSPKKSSKRLSEIDRLLMDEGAVNMLYDINNSEDQKRRASSRTAVASNDKAQLQKELMDRTQEIKNELTQGTSSETTPKILRKKEGTPTAKKDTPGPQAVRKMSKDSTKSSIHSPPPSPAAFTLAEASRIIRRHSSSSFSSNDELVQESLAELEEKQQEKEKQLKKKLASAETSSSKTLPETTSPDKQTKERPVKKRLTSAPESAPSKKIKKDDVKEDEYQQQKPVEIAMKCEPGIVTGELKTDPNRTFTLIKMNKHYMINLTYSGGENYLTVQLLKDLTFTLKELVRNKNCNVVSIHSQGPAFCLGLDYKGLIESDADLRKKRAKELSACVREFLKCLLHFPKVLVAGIRGDCVGFGVTMLPLFDMIVASDSASFCSPYAKLGCAPEAGFLLSIPFQPNHALASELLYTSQRMNADEAQRRGLVTKLFWPEKFDTEFRALLMHISNLSRVGLMRIKKELRVLHSQSTEAALNSSCRMLIKCWCSEECQKSFSNYNALTFDIDQ